MTDDAIDYSSPDQTIEKLFVVSSKPELEQLFVCLKK
jgi:hypothetical protein